MKQELSSGKQQQQSHHKQEQQDQQQDQDLIKNDMKQTDGKFTFGPPPPVKLKPHTTSASSGSFSKYQNGKSLADSFVTSMTSSFASDGGGGGNGDGDAEGEAIESTGTDTLNQGSPVTQGSIVSSLRDLSTQIDGFEKDSELNWSFPQEFSWQVVAEDAYEGKSSMKSGLPSDVKVGTSLYSNLTLSIDNEYVDRLVGKSGGGAVLSFQIKATEALSWPTSAFMVTVGDEIALSPSDVESLSSISKNRNDWVEFSIIIDTNSGTTHDIKFIHVVNPLALEILPTSSLDFFLDDVRLAPFTSDTFDMTTVGSNGAKWTEMSGTIVATTDSIDQGTGYADLSFVVTSKFGGTLKYELNSSTQAPFDDLAVIINGKLQESQFGESVDFEWISMDLDRGKQKVTFMHRKNPGGLGDELLQGLGAVKTDGKNTLKNIEFWKRE
jgi:hypothetical protein